MARLLTILVLVCLPRVAAAADDFKVLQLEQDVRELTRQMQAQSRQIDELRRQLASPGAGAAGASRTPAGPPRTDPDAGARPGTVGSGTTADNPSDPAWLDATRWARLKPGAPEFEVIQALGPPTSMRMQGEDRVLFYALEIGASVFLGGSVTLRDRVVTGIRLPVLQ
jgi:hypothetical protein